MLPARKRIRNSTVSVFINFNSCITIGAAYVILYDVKVCPFAFVIEDRGLDIKRNTSYASDICHILSAGTVKSLRMAADEYGLGMV